MEFCESCGSMLKPVREEKETYLLCSKCGKKHKLTKTDGYKIVRKIDHPPTDRFEVTELKKRKALTDEEREELEDYYGDMLEQMEVE